VRELHDNSEPLICFPAVQQSWDTKRKKDADLNALDVRKPLAVSISQSSEKLRLYNLI
jgi:hypothetical protein